MSSIHSLADIAECKIGKETRIWQYVVVLEGAVIGENCNICAHTLIEGNVVVGDRVTVKSGVFLWDGTRIEDDVYIWPNATFTNDSHPRSKAYPEEYRGITVKKGASIGVNVTMLPGVTIGENSMIDAGSVVVKDVHANAVVVGNPGRIIKYL